MRYKAQFTPLGTAHKVRDLEIVVLGSRLIFKSRSLLAVPNRVYCRVSCD